MKKQKQKPKAKANTQEGVAPTWKSSDPVNTELIYPVAHLWLTYSKDQSLNSKCPLTRLIHRCGFHRGKEGSVPHPMPMRVKVFLKFLL